jgi:sugar-specific transcriptional regulator TrmB
MAEKPTLGQKYQDVSETLKNATDMLNRIDERVEIFMKEQRSLKERLDHHIEHCPFRETYTDLVTRVSVLESKNGSALKKDIQGVDDRVRDLELKVQAVKIISTGNQSKWGMIGDAVMKVVVIVAATILTSVLVWKFGMGF